MEEVVEGLLFNHFLDSFKTKLHLGIYRSFFISQSEHDPFAWYQCKWAFIGFMLWLPEDQENSGRKLWHHFYPLHMQCLTSQHSLIHSFEQIPAWANEPSQCFSGQPMPFQFSCPLEQSQAEDYLFLGSYVPQLFNLKYICSSSWLELYLCCHYYWFNLD